MDKPKSSRNKTITLSEDEKNYYSKQISYIQGQVTETEITNKIICTDLLSVIDHFPKQFADVIILDPPYNHTKNFDGNKFIKRSDKEYYEYLKAWFPQVISLLKPSGSLYLCGDWKCSVPHATIMAEHLHLRNRITWQREKGRGAKNNWKNCTEDIWFGTTSDDYYFNIDAVKLKRKVLAPYKENGKPKDWTENQDGKFRLTFPSNFWDDITIPFWSMSENTEHPTQKPEKLIAKLLLASCPEGGIVFDPFLGSGASAVVAKKLGRRYCGIDISENYCMLALKRLLLADVDDSIQGYIEGVFWERNSVPR